jgi:hypothetical protein
VPPARRPTDGDRQPDGVAKELVLVDGADLAAADAEQVGAADATEVRRVWPLAAPTVELLRAGRP